MKSASIMTVDHLPASAFLCVDLFDNLGCSHYVALCYLVFPYSFFIFTSFVFRKIYLTTVTTRISFKLKTVPVLPVWRVSGLEPGSPVFPLLFFSSLRHDDFQTDLSLPDPNRISVRLMRNKSVKRTWVMIMKGKYKQVLSAPLTDEPFSF